MCEPHYFEIIDFIHGDYRFAIFATTSINPLSVLSAIEEILKERGESYFVLFDLLLSNGETSNRYISAFFDGKKFQHDTFKLIKRLPKEFKNIASQYYAKRTGDKIKSS